MQSNLSKMGTIVTKPYLYVKVQYRNSLFSSYKFLHKKFSRKNFLSRSNWTKVFLQVLCKLMMPSEMEMPCSVRGYHVYKEVREAVIREVLECHREPTNTSFHVLNCSKNFRCIIIYVQKNFGHFQRTKIFLRQKKQITVVLSMQGLGRFRIAGRTEAI